MIRSIRQVGQTIRELRKKRGITGEEMGRRAGLSQSKISKIETGYYTRLQYGEIKKILNILGASHTITQQILRVVDDAAHNADSKVWFYEYNYSHASGELEQRANLIRIYTANGIPALLQTTAYRTASLQRKGILGDELNDYLKRTVERQDLLWNEKRVFHLILPQAALYTLEAPKRVHVAQLDRLERVISGMLSVKLGVIPVEAGTVLIEHSSFALYDEHTLIQALARYEITTQDQQEIECHSDVFTALERLAFYDDDAIALIRKAVDYFS